MSGQCTQALLRWVQRSEGGGREKGEGEAGDKDDEDAGREGGGDAGKDRVQMGVAEGSPAGGPFLRSNQVASDGLGTAGAARLAALHGLQLPCNGRFDGQSKTTVVRQLAGGFQAGEAEARYLAYLTRILDGRPVSSLLVEGEVADGEGTGEKKAGKRHAETKESELEGQKAKKKRKQKNGVVAQTGTVDDGDVGGKGSISSEACPVEWQHWAVDQICRLAAKPPKSRSELLQLLGGGSSEEGATDGQQGGKMSAARAGLKAVFAVPSAVLHFLLHKALKRDRDEALTEQADAGLDLGGKHSNADATSGDGVADGQSDTRLLAASAFAPRFLSALAAVLTAAEGEANRATRQAGGGRKEKGRGGRGRGGG